MIKKKPLTFRLKDRVSYFLLINVFAVIVEGVIILLILLAKPSEPNPSNILGYSLSRWMFLIINLLPVGVAILIGHKILTKTDTFIMLDQWVKKYSLNIFINLLVFSLGITSILVFSLSTPALTNYFNHILPTVVWFLIFLLQNLFLYVLFWGHDIRCDFEKYMPVHSPDKIQHSKKVVSYTIIGIAVVYLSLQVYQHVMIKSANWIGDSVDYIFPNEHISIAKIVFWPYAKAWGPAVLYQLVGSSPINIDLVQTIFSTAAWLFLAWTFSRFFSTSIMKLIGFISILAFSLVDQVQLWNHVILSESLSITLMILGIALWLNLILRWNWLVFLSLLFTMFYWINTREANPYLALLIAVELIMIGLFFRKQRFYWLVSCMLMLFSFNTLQVSENAIMPRWAYPLSNVILQRILPQPEYKSFFVNHGMPDSPELNKGSGQWADYDNYAIFNSPELKSFEHWLYSSGKTTYMKFLIYHPVYTTTAPLKNLPVMFASTYLISYVPYYHSVFPRIIDDLLFPITWFEGYGWFCLVAIGGAVLLKSWKSTPAFWMVLSLLILSAPHVYLVYHGDAMELGRHAIQANIQLRLSILMIMLLFLNALVKRYLKKAW